MTIEEESVQFLETQISGNYKEIFDKYLLNELEWYEIKDGAHGVADLIDPETDTLSNIVVLFPPFKPTAKS